MKTREIQRLAAILKRFGVTAKEDKYHWGRHYLCTYGTRLYWGNEETGKTRRWHGSPSAPRMASWLFHECVYLTVPQSQRISLVSAVLPDISNRKAKIGYKYFTGNNSLDVPDNIHHVVFGYFAGDIPEGILLDAFLHDTDIFT